MNQQADYIFEAVTLSLYFSQENTKNISGIQHLFSEEKSIKMMEIFLMYFENVCRNSEI